MTYIEYKKLKDEYYKKVWIYTEIHKNKLPNIELRGLGNCIDHIIPITLGFHYSIPPCVIGSLSNIRIISTMDNLTKANRITEDVKNKIDDLGIILSECNKIKKPKKNILIYPDYAY